MKSFFKYTLATIIGLLITTFFLSMIGFFTLFGIAMSDEAKPTIKNKSILHINLNGTIEERFKQSPFSALTGNDLVATQGLNDLLAAIRVAKTNKNIKGIYIEAGAIQTSPATMQELRQAILDFKKTKKFVVAYGENVTGGAYYIASAADKFYLNPTGMIDWHGLASQTLFYKDVLDKLGIKMQIFKVGTYKSAVEPYTRSEMSDANRQQVNSFIQDIWGNMLHETSLSRHRSDSAMNNVANQYTALLEVNDYTKVGLADSICYLDGIRSKLRILAQSDEVNLVSSSDLAKLDNRENSSDKIAVYYAYGNIVDKAASGINSENEIVGQKVISDLDKLANDDDVKAVVLRINSGGGSAAASEQMWHAIDLLKKKKPVIVSMGGMAASGGYYMSCGADYIIAQPMTLTGSIGIFGMIPDASELLKNKIGLRSDVVKTNESSDFGNYMRPFNSSESAAMQAYVERGYRLFLKRVASGRKMTPQNVDKIAQGRVWTGQQALKIKLVDKLGSLDDAIAEAAKRSKLTDYSINEYPEPKLWFEDLFDQTSNNYMERKMKTLFGVYYQPVELLQNIQNNSRLQARIPYMIDFHL